MSDQKNSEASKAATPDGYKPGPMLHAGKLLDEITALPVLWGLNEPGALLRHSDVSKVITNAAKSATALSSDVVRNAARYSFLRETTKAIRNDEGTERIECTPEQFDAAIDKAMAAAQSVN